MDIPKSKYQELDCYWTWMGDDGIARTKVKPGAEIELQHAVENAKVVNNFQEGDMYPIIVDTTGIKSISKEARDYFSMRDRESRVNAIAIIRKSSLGNMVGNFFIKLNKPVVPTKLFVNEGDAISWCRKFKKQEDVVG